MFYDKKYIGLAVFALLAGITVAIFSSQKESNWPSAVGFNYQPPKNIVVSPLTMAPEQSLPEQTLEGSESNINPSELTTLSEEFFIDKWTVAFIGFTYCPDICPAAMNNLARLEKAIA
jgi:SCO1/SenC.